MMIFGNISNFGVCENLIALIINFNSDKKLPTF